MSLQHVSTPKGPSSESMTDSFQQEVQQNESSDVKIQRIVQRVVFTQQPYDSRGCCVKHYTLLTILNFISDNQYPARSK
jgi:hypothetical protein